jgi:hypothetical protein
MLLAQQGHDPEYGLRMGEQGEEVHIRPMDSNPIEPATIRDRARSTPIARF